MGDRVGREVVYGKRYLGVIRSSVVIDARGKAATVFDKFQPKAQSKKSLEAVRGLVSA